GGELYQRADDQPEVVRRRLQVQWPEVQGLADFYGRQRKLVEIDGERPVEQVEEELLATVLDFPKELRDSQLWGRDGITEFSIDEISRLAKMWLEMRKDERAGFVDDLKKTSHVFDRHVYAIKMSVKVLGR
ncbi:MAG: hypothetical protein HY533_06655, partial [Chloroflexi bacterium]|nr:hypothetical protein [Chloroflexota bacterium]